MAKAIPDGYQTITPICVFKDARKALAFYQAAFGARELFTALNPDGKSVMHGEMQIGSSRVMFCDEAPHHVGKGVESRGGSPVSFYLYVPDADAAFQKAVAAGCAVEMPVQEMFWGDRMGALKDPFGHSWVVATHVKDVSDEQIKQAIAQMAKK